MRAKPAPAPRMSRVGSAARPSSRSNRASAMCCSRWRASFFRQRYSNVRHAAGGGQRGLRRGRVSTWRGLVRAVFPGRPGSRRSGGPNPRGCTAFVGSGAGCGCATPTPRPSSQKKGGASWVCAGCRWRSSCFKPRATVGPLCRRHRSSTLSFKRSFPGERNATRTRGSRSGQRARQFDSPSGP
jgi:hypothetical protein